MLSMATAKISSLLSTGLTQFAVWWQPLLQQDSLSIICQLEAMFFEQGPPDDTAFCSRQFNWGVHLQM